MASAAPSSVEMTRDVRPEKRWRDFTAVLSWSAVIFHHMRRQVLKWRQKPEHRMTIRRAPAGAHPDLLHPEYRSTTERAPRQPSIPLPQGPAELSGPSFDV